MIYFITILHMSSKENSVCQKNPLLFNKCSLDIIISQPHAPDHILSFSALLCAPPLGTTSSRLKLFGCTFYSSNGRYQKEVRGQKQVVGIFFSALFRLQHCASGLGCNSQQLQPNGLPSLVQISPCLLAIIVYHLWIFSC